MPERADREVGAGELVQLVGHRDVGDHPAEVEHGAGDEQQAEVPGLPQRRRVQPHRLQPIAQRHGRKCGTAPARAHSTLSRPVVEWRGRGRSDARSRTFRRAVEAFRGAVEGVEARSRSPQARASGVERGQQDRRDRTEPPAAPGLPLRARADPKGAGRRAGRSPRPRCGPTAPSLARMLETCTLTVLVLMNSCRAISPLLRPSRDQREDLAPRGRSGRVRPAGVGPRARHGPTVAPSSASSGSAPSPAAAARAAVRSVARASSRCDRPRRSTARQPGLRPRRLERVAHRLEGRDGALPGGDQLLLRGRVDAGQPAQPEVLGVAPGRPRRCPRARTAACALQDSLLDPLDGGEQRRDRPVEQRGPLGRRDPGTAVGQLAQDERRPTRIRAWKCGFQMRADRRDHLVVDAPASRSRSPASPSRSIAAVAADDREHPVAAPRAVASRRAVEAVASPRPAATIMRDRVEQRLARRAAPAAASRSSSLDRSSQSPRM